MNESGQVFIRLQGFKTGMEKTRAIIAIKQSQITQCNQQ